MYGEYALFLDTVRLTDAFLLRALKWISKKRVERLQEIARLLKDSDYDIICFQELWTGYDFMKQTLSRKFPYSKYWRTAAVGSGLAIFSKFPILSSQVYQYSLNGSPAELGGDWFAGKACVSALLWHPILGELEVFNTHVSRACDLPSLP